MTNAAANGLASLTDSSTQAAALAGAVVLHTNMTDGASTAVLGASLLNDRSEEVRVAAGNNLTKQREVNERRERNAYLLFAFLSLLVATVVIIALDRLAPRS